MELKDVLQQCPKAAERFYQFAGRVLSGLHQMMAQENGETEVEDIDLEMGKQYGPILLDYNRRTLFDFFDGEGIAMEIGVDRTMEPKFCYSFDTTNSDLFYSREEAEVEGFKEAFRLLENKL